MVTLVKNSPELEATGKETDPDPLTARENAEESINTRCPSLMMKMEQLTTSDGAGAAQEHEIFAVDALGGVFTTKATTKSVGPTCTCWATEEFTVNVKKVASGPAGRANATKSDCQAFGVR